MKKFLSSIFKNKVKGRKRRIFVCFLLIWFLKVSPVKGAPILGVDGFTPICRCLKSQTYSREITSLSTRLHENPTNENIPRQNKTRYNRRIKEYGVILEDLQIRNKYKHAGDFGVKGNPSRENFELFKDRITDHMRDPSTIIKEGTYKKNIDVMHYVNENTGLNVMIRQDDNTFLSGWKLNEKQLQNLKNKGAL